MSAAEPLHLDPPHFEIVLVREDDVVVVMPEGELDISTVEDLRAWVLDLPARGCRNVALDLSQLTFVDSCAIHLLTDLRAAAALEGFSFSVRLGDATPARRLLALVDLADRFALA